MDDLGLAHALDGLDAAYQQTTAVVTGLTEAELMLPSRCAGWALADVIYHQLLDARRALRTFATPASGPPDRDDVTYWQEFAPDASDGEPPGGTAAAEHARYVRIAASAYPPGMLAWEWSETAAAACRAARACPHEKVATQGHVLRLADFVATLVVEAGVHYLDLTAPLPAAAAPRRDSLDLVKRVLAGLLGAPLPSGWDDVTAVLKGTGREPLTQADRDLLGAGTGKFPLFG